VIFPRDEFSVIVELRRANSESFDFYKNLIFWYW